ncbi:MAG: hypothetical protein F3741_03925 [Nitrospinae bacterium]|nr:hypothetical protein [Nitrospinota bacterium]
MASENDKKKRLGEYLWAEINKAILQSPDVQLYLRKLEKLNLIDYVSEYNLVLEVDKLIDNILKKGNSTESSSGEIQLEKDLIIEKSERKSSDITSAFSPKPMQWIDGKILSKNEILFEEYLNLDFDEKHWMKKAKIRFEN